MPPQKRRRVAEEANQQLARLLEASGPTPPDFGGRVASMLWDVEVQYFSKVEYIHLFFGLGNVPIKMRTRRVVSPELYSLLRCSRLVRQGLIAAVEMRRLTMEPEESTDERSRVDELCSALRYKYPASWARAWGQGRLPEETEPACLAADSGLLSDLHLELGHFEVLTVLTDQS
eukprot:s832_g15.t1